MNFRYTLASIIEKVLPSPISEGPPIPKVFQVKWPYGTQGKIPEPIYNVGTKINSITYGMVRRIG